MKTEILEIITQHKYDHISSEQAVSELLDLFAVSVSLRDYIATECMKSEIIAWNKEMSYEMADAMLSARSNER